MKYRCEHEIWLCIELSGGNYYLIKDPVKIIRDGQDWQRTHSRGRFHGHCVSDFAEHPEPEIM